MARKAMREYEFGAIYPMYVAKVEKKGRSRADLDRVIQWLTGYDDAQLQKQKDGAGTLEAFFDAAPQMHANTDQIKGLVCGIRVEDIEDPLDQKIRWMDKLVDELARGKKIESILR
jgi:hypothetical protein